MQKLRSLHLYLGCLFAPMLLFFTISGIWQTLGFHSRLLNALSTIHTSHGMKGSSLNLTSPWMLLFVLAMALAFIITTVLGIAMAFKFTHSRRAAFYCLSAGVVVPLLMVIARLLLHS